jgi:uncharacterized protein
MDTSMIKGIHYVGYPLIRPILTNAALSNAASTSNTGDNEVLRILYQHSPWWLNKPISQTKLKPFKRRDYFKILPRLEDNKILALVGPRQVGKTTIVYQLIDKLLVDGVEPQKIFFASLDDPYLNVTLKNWAKVFDLYSTTILKEPLNELTGRIYLFLDEIQTLKNWESVLKRWYDLGYDMKFVVTGSSSMGINEGASEALVGRINLQIVFPMKFLEYVQFKEDGIAESIKSRNKQMRLGLRSALMEGRPEAFYEVVSEQANALSPYKDRILVHFNNYLIKGGYPDIANKDDLVEASQYLKNYLHLTMYKDIVLTRKVRDPVALESLFAIVAKNSSQILNREQLGQQLGIKRDTLNTYIYLLKSAFLVSESEFFSESRIKRARRERKIFVNDIGIRNVSSSLFDESILANTSEMGRMIETVVADHTRRLRFNLEATPFPPLFYWREKYEVDFIIDPFGKVLPIEVKYREDVSDADLEGLKEFSKKFAPPLSIVVTKNQLSLKGTTVYIPVWLYLLLC